MRIMKVFNGIADTARCCSNRCTCRSGPRPRYSNFFAVVILALLSQPLWADVTASLSRDVIYDGDTVTLVIETTDMDHDGDPDYSVLQKDFDILGTRNSRQTQIINGQRSDKRQWHVELAPKNSGSIMVPAVRVGNEMTGPIPLSVKPQPAAQAAGPGQPAFVKAEIEPENGVVYVQQQVHYTLKLYYHDSLAEGSFDGLDIDDALIERLGDDHRYSTTINGEHYQVLERRFAIFPEKSGELVIPAAVFNGRMAGEPLQRRRSSGMSSMMDRFFGENMLRTPGKRVRLRSDAITLDIKPRPAAYSGDSWLPSAQLVLNDSWAEGPPEFRVGEPVTRTITLEAKGLESSHLPDITLASGNGVRLYPEKPEQATRTDGKWVYGISKQAVAYVPTASGRITLPEIRLDWWDTATQQQRTAVIPSWEINVLPGEGGAAETFTPAAAEADAPPVLEVADIAVDEPPGGADQRNRLAVALLVLVLFITAVYFWRKRGRQDVEPVTNATTASSVKQQLAQGAAALEKACQQNDAPAAARALLQWAAARWPDDAPRNLGALTRQLENGTDEIRALERALYAADRVDWQGQALWQVFSHGFREKAVASDRGDQDELSPLYPY